MEFLFCLLSNWPEDGSYAPVEVPRASPSVGESHSLAEKWQVFAHVFGHPNRAQVLVLHTGSQKEWFWLENICIPASQPKEENFPEKLVHTRNV